MADRATETEPPKQTAAQIASAAQDLRDKEIDVELAKYKQDKKHDPKILPIIADIKKAQRDNLGILIKGLEAAEKDPDNASTINKNAEEAWYKAYRAQVESHHVGTFDPQKTPTKQAEVDKAFDIADPSGWDRAAGAAKSTGNFLLGTVYDPEKEKFKTAGIIGVLAVALLAGFGGLFNSLGGILGGLILMVGGGYIANLIGEHVGNDKTTKSTGDNGITQTVSLDGLQKGKTQTTELSQPNNKEQRDAQNLIKVAESVQGTTPKYPVSGNEELASQFKNQRRVDSGGNGLTVTS